MNLGETSRKPYISIFCRKHQKGLDVYVARTRLCIYVACHSMSFIVCSMLGIALCMSVIAQKFS